MDTVSRVFYFHQDLDLTLELDNNATYHTTLPVDCEQGWAAFQPDDSLSEVVSTYLKSEAKNRGECVIILLPDFLWSQVIITCLFTKQDKDYITQSVFSNSKDLVPNVPPTNVYKGKEVCEFVSNSRPGSYLLFVYKPGQVGWWVGLPGGTKGLKCLSNLIFFFYTGNSRLLIRKI